jgi:hypothetical protein
MGFVLKKNDSGIWYDLPSVFEVKDEEGKVIRSFNLPTGVRLKIRALPLSKAFDLQSKVRKKVLVRVPTERDPSKSLPEFIDDANPEGLVVESFRYMLQEWEGIELDESVQNLKPDDIKDLLFDHDGIRLFVTSKANEQLEAVRNQKEKEEGN